MCIKEIIQLYCPRCRTPGAKRVSVARAIENSSCDGKCATEDCVYKDGGDRPSTKICDACTRASAPSPATTRRRSGGDRQPHRSSRAPSEANPTQRNTTSTGAPTSTNTASTADPDVTFLFTRSTAPPRHRTGDADRRIQRPMRTLTTITTNPYALSPRSIAPTSATTRGDYVTTTTLRTDMGRINIADILSNDTTNIYATNRRRYQTNAQHHSDDSDSDRN